jgi:glutaredoxin
MTFVAVLALLLMAPVSARSGEPQRTDQCLLCHGAMGDKPSTLFRHDVHFKKGISCSGCHGGDPTKDEMELAMNPKAGFIGVPRGNQISEVCAHCHADPNTMKSYGSSLPTNQYQLLRGSVHGEYAVQGKQRIAQCISCHGAHGIVSPKDPSSPVYPTKIIATCGSCHSNAPYMQKYNPALPVDQVEKYRTSVHGKRNAHGDRKVAQCASCHGSHDIRPPKDTKSSIYPVNVPQTCAKCHADPAYMKSYRIPTDQYENYVKSVHGIALLENHDTGAPACNSCHGNHGATPPGVESISKVCGTCHALNAELFGASTHKRVFDERKIPECESCHGNHLVEHATASLLGVTDGATCARCHTPRDTSQGYAAARDMRALMDSLSNTDRSATTILNQAEQKGMEVSEASFKLRGARQALMESRTVVHSFDLEKFKTVVDKGLAIASNAQEEGDQAIHEYYVRRVGLGIATLFMTLLAVSLFFVIRRIERKK